MGDAAAARYPNHGRILVTQFSVFAGVPLSLILMKVCCPCCMTRVSALPAGIESCIRNQGKGTTPTTRYKVWSLRFKS